jgi:hypothetical protein
LPSGAPHKSNRSRMRLHDQESPDTIARGLTEEPVVPTNFRGTQK